MDKNILELKIKREAYSKLCKEWEEAKKLINNHRLLVDIEIEGENIGEKIGTCDNYMPIDDTGEASEGYENTNVPKVLLKRFEELKEQELNDLLKKLETVKYLFEE